MFERKFALAESLLKLAARDSTTIPLKALALPARSARWSRGDPVTFSPPTAKRLQFGCMLTLRTVTVIEDALPIPMTRCLGARASFPRACIFLGGKTRPTNRVIIWFDPLQPDREHALAHEYGHGITMTNPAFSHLDPRLVSEADRADRRLAGLISSIVDHPIVHRTIERFGFDPSPERERRTRDALPRMTRAFAESALRRLAAGDSAAREPTLMNAEMPTTFRCTHTRASATVVAVTASRRPARRLAGGPAAYRPSATA